MTTIIGISGSLRETSFNSALLRAAKDVTPEGATLEIASIRCEERLRQYQEEKNSVSIDGLPALRWTESA